MASFNKIQSAVFDSAGRQQYYQTNLAGLTAQQRHDKFMTDYLKHYGGTPRVSDPYAKTKKTDYDVLQETYRFIRTEQDDVGNSWEVRLAKKYYDRLYKEYCIADLSRYKESKIGLRWRTQREVVDGVGQFVCGAKGCKESRGLCSYEVNFGYVEAGEKKQALVKLRLCPDCACKLNYKKEKQYRKAQTKLLKRKNEHLESSKRKHNKQTKEDDSADEDPSEAAPGAPTPSAFVAPQVSVDIPPQTVPTSVLPADDTVWEQKPERETTMDEEFEEYFDGMFL